MVEFNNSIFTEDEGIIFIPDAQSGSYDLKVQGVDQGKYEIIVGQISENNDIWDSINGEITKSPASSQIDNHNIIYNNQTALSIFPTPTTTITSTITPVPTELINQSLTVTPTTVAQSTNSTSSTNSSSNNEILISKESSPAVLGISSSQEELISPTIEVAMQTETKKEIKKSLNIWDYIWPSTISLILGGVGWLFRKKFLKK